MGKYVYDAFISYSHKDLEWGRRLQRELEGYRLPRELRREKNGNVRLKIFRDQTDLAGAELKESLTRELERSRFLIVICSPASAASRWVDDEIRTFCAMGRANRVIPFIIDGEPMSDRPELECFPPALREMEDAEPLGVSILEIGRHKAMLKTVSVLLDVRFDRLVNREKQRRRKTILTIASGALAVAAVVGGLLIKNAEISQDNKEMSFDVYGAAILALSQKNSLEPKELAFIQTSAEEGNLDAMHYLAYCYRYGIGTEANPEEAYNWYQRSADLGDPRGMVALGQCYMNGIGTDVNPKMVYFWGIKGAEAGNADAMVNLGFCYQTGYGTEENPEQAFQWYKRAAEKKDEQGILRLGTCYLLGTGTEENPDLAFDCMRQLAEMGNTDGMYNLGLLYNFGIGTEENPEQAYHWYRKAAEAGDANGMRMLAWCIENKYGTGDLALEWYRRAAEKGNKEAKADVERLTGSGQVEKNSESLTDSTETQQAPESQTDNADVQQAPESQTDSADAQQAPESPAGGGEAR